MSYGIITGASVVSELAMLIPATLLPAVEYLETVLVVELQTYRYVFVLFIHKPVGLPHGAALVEFAIRTPAAFPPLVEYFAIVLPPVFETYTYVFVLSIHILNGDIHSTPVFVLFAIRIPAAFPPLVEYFTTVLLL
jgi:hypothetical protein